jgi:hypothetical protein
MVTRVIVLMMRKVWRAARASSPKHGRSRCKRAAVLMLNLLFVVGWRPTTAAEVMLKHSFGTRWWYVVVVVVVVTIEHRAISNLTSPRCDYQPQFRAASTTAAHAPSHHHHHHRDDKLAHSDVNAVPTHDRRAAHSAYRFCVVVVVFHTGNVKFFWLNTRCCCRYCDPDDCTPPESSSASYNSTTELGKASRTTTAVLVKRLCLYYCRFAQHQCVRQLLKML